MFPAGTPGTSTRGAPSWKEAAGKRLKEGWKEAEQKLETERVRGGWTNVRRHQTKSIEVEEERKKVAAAARWQKLPTSRGEMRGC